MGRLLAWMVWMVCLHGWRASVDDAGGMLPWMVC